MEAIAARAGVGKQTIYRWWSSKGAVLVDAFAEPRSDLDPAVAAPDWGHGDFAADLAQVVADTVAEFATPTFEAPYRAVVVAIQGDPQLADDVRARVIRPGLDAVTAWLERAQTAGALAPDLDLTVAAEIIFGPIFHRWLLGTGPLDADYATALTLAVEHALRTR